MPYQFQGASSSLYQPNSLLTRGHLDSYRPESSLNSYHRGQETGQRNNMVLHSSMRGALFPEDSQDNKNSAQSVRNTAMFIQQYDEKSQGQASSHAQ